MDAEDAEWHLELGLDQIATIFAMEGWPLIDGVATAEKIETVIGNLVAQMAESPKLLGVYGGRLMIRRNPSAPTCVELSFDFGHLDFAEALEEREKGA